jgi:hypothetical protein
MRRISRALQRSIAMEDWPQTMQACRLLALFVVEDNRETGIVFALESAPLSGQRGRVLTPSFETRQELEDFCRVHAGVFRVLSQAKESPASAPQKAVRKNVMPLSSQTLCDGCQEIWG